MSFKLTILGCDSAIPTVDKQQTAQLLNVNERFFLIDCGENTQVQLRKYQLSFQRISHILISHLHGDHYYGLIGLITSMHLLGRKKELHIYAHEILKEIINVQLSASNTNLNYPLFFHVLPANEEKILFKDDNIEISNFLLDHTIDCSGFLFKEISSKREIIQKKIDEHKIPFDKIHEIKKGANYINENNQIINNNELTTLISNLHSYAYCSDTRFSSRIIPIISNVDILYHEATFSKELDERANETGHSTTKDAANIAKEANVKKLLIGHYSKRYKDLNMLLDESKQFFHNTFLTKEGDVFDFDSF
ncbi:MAG: ribonuclease Z [Flavobacteriales bacterium]|nr:ribonuclease Z [Flavobacteriales bacterium]OUW94281.1 MAG: ribonuclease Z [Flavobacteriales bacterium TMED228]|tara:strand:- start:3362 stop:4282 length:921 start_codon:yes stop_codon:yes gene_type:complete